LELIDRRLTATDQQEGPLSDDEKRTRLHDLVKEAQREAEHHHAAGHDSSVSWTNLRDFYAGPGQNWDKVAPDLPTHLQSTWSVTNHTKTACSTFVSTIVGALPAWYVVELGSGEADGAADRVTTYLRAWRQFVSYEAEEKMVISNALQVGLGVLKPWWNKHYGGGRGEVVVSSVRPENIFPDPTALKLEECSYVAIRNLYGIERALKMWPKLDLAKVLTTAGETDEFLGDEEINETKAAECIVVWEVYYDFGARLMIYSGEQTLHDGPSPVPKSEVLPHRYPLHFYEFETRDDNFWPVGLVQELIDPQNRINTGNTKVNIWHLLAVNPIWDTTSSMLKEAWDTTPGSMNLREEGSEVTAHWPPPLPSDVFAHIQNSKADLDNISGSVEVTRGLRPTGVNTGIALQVLHEAAQQRMTGPAANWAHAKGQLGQRVLELMQKHYSDDRQLAIVEEAGGSLVEIGADDFSREEPTGNFIEEGGETLPEMNTEPRRYVVVTQPGGDIPMSASARAEMAIQLKQIPSSAVQMTVVDDEATLDAVQFPGRDKIKERKEQVLQAEAAGEQQAMQMQQQMQTQAAAQQQMQVIAQQLQELLPPEMFTFLQSLMAGTMSDQGLIAEFMQTVQELGQDVYALVMQYLALAQQAGQMQPQAQPTA